MVGMNNALIRINQQRILLKDDCIVLDKNFCIDIKAINVEENNPSMIIRSASCLRVIEGKDAQDLCQECKVSFL